jgi:putative ABC transport system permease protein
MSLPYSLTIIWRERSRFLPAVLAVAFSAVLIAAQLGLVIGMLSYASVPIDRTNADIWITNRDVETITLSHPFPEAWLLRLVGTPEIDRVEVYLYGVGPWHKPGTGSSELCCIVGSHLEEGSLGSIRELTPELRARLAEPGAVVIDASEVKRLGLKHGVGEFAEVAGQRVRVVGMVEGIPSTTAPYLFCSLETARRLLPLFTHRRDLAMYVLATCKDPRDVPAVVHKLRGDYPDMAVWTSKDFSLQTRVYWLIRSKAGTAMLCTGGLALLVGLVVTSQTLYAATVASLREYAVLDALGIPRWRMAWLVVAKSFWIGVAGIALSLPTVYLLSFAAGFVDAVMHLPLWLLAATAALTMTIALLSGLAALRSLRLVEPATLLR